MKYVLAIISIMLGAIAQYFLKQGVKNLSTENGNAVLKVLFDNNLWIGICCYGLSMIFWLYVLSKLELSRAYPMVSLGYVFTLFLGYYFLNEPITLFKIIGVGLIILGVLFLSGS